MTDKRRSRRPAHVTPTRCAAGDSREKHPRERISSDGVPYHGNRGQHEASARPAGVQAGEVRRCRCRCGLQRHMSFGAGWSICPGLALTFTLAVMELGLASLLFHFDWSSQEALLPMRWNMTEALGIMARRKSELWLCIH